MRQMTRVFKPGDKVVYATDPGSPLTGLVLKRRVTEFVGGGEEIELFVQFTPNKDAGYACARSEWLNPNVLILDPKEA